MKRTIIAATVVVLLAGIGIGGWFGATALTEDDNGYTPRSTPVRLAQPTQPSIPTSCNEVVLCKSWELTLFGSKEARSSFELMAKACGLPTDLRAPQYALICRR